MDGGKPLVEVMAPLAKGQPKVVFIKQSGVLIVPLPCELTVIWVTGRRSPQITKSLRTVESRYCFVRDSICHSIIIAGPYQSLGAQAESHAGWRRSHLGPLKSMPDSSG